MINTFYSIQEETRGLIIAVVLASVCVALYSFLALNFVDSKMASNIEKSPPKAVVLASKN